MTGFEGQSHSLSVDAGAAADRIFRQVQAAISTRGARPQVLSADSTPTGGSVMAAMDTASDPGGIADLELGTDPVDTAQTSSGDGWTCTETVHYVPNTDGSYTLNISSDDSYGDPSAAGSDVSGMDAGTVPSGGTDSYSISISMSSDGSMTITTNQDSYDSFSESGTLEGANNSGTWTGSGSDSYHSTDTVTFNTDGSTTETSWVSSESSYKFAFTVSGTTLGGAYTLAGDGSGNFNFSETNAADGSVTRHENDSEFQHLNLDGAGNDDGAHVTADVSETVGFIDDLTPSTDGSGDSSETTTSTDVGSESYSYDGSGNLYDGASFSGNESSSETFNNTETVVTAISAGQTTLVSDDYTGHGTNQYQYDLSVSGVHEYGDPSEESEEDISTYQGTEDRTSHQEPGSSSSYYHTVSTQTNHTSGSDSYGPFGSDSHVETDLTITEVNGQSTTDNQSPPATGSSFGTPPFGGQFQMDFEGLKNEAEFEPKQTLVNVYSQVNDYDQLAYAQGPIGKAIQNRRDAKQAQEQAEAQAEQNVKQAMNQVVSTRLPTYTYDQAMAVNNVDKLKTIREGYQMEYQNNLAASERLQSLADDYLNQADLKMGFNLGIFSLEKKSVFGTLFIGFLGDAVHLTNIALGNMFHAMSVVYASEALRLESTISNLTHAINDLTLQDVNQDGAD